MGSSLGLKEQNKLKENALHGPIKCYELKSIINAIEYRQRPKIKGGGKKSEKNMISFKKMTTNLGFPFPKTFK